MAELSWSAEQYVRFERERTRPVRDLLGAVPPIAPRRAVDLGCGPGNSTEVLAERFPCAEIVGLDASPEMIAAARRRLPAVHFSIQDLRAWVTAAPRPAVELIVANAVLQWVADHGTLLPALLGRLEPGGVLAVQVPDNLAEPAQVLMREVAAEGAWATKLAQADASRVPIEAPGWYHQVLSAAGARVDVWRTTYFHALAGDEAIVEWFKATGLRPFLEPLAAAERAAFLERYAERIRAAYPPLPDGTVLLPFPRLFIVAQRAGGGLS